MTRGVVQIQTLRQRARDHLLVGRACRPYNPEQVLGGRAPDFTRVNANGRRAEAFGITRVIDPCCS